MSSRNAEPPQFILTFNVSDAPATTVYCNVNDVPIGNMTVSRGILNGKPPTLTNVAVTIRQRIAGVYNCTVSNNRVEDNTVHKPVAYSGHAVVNIKGKQYTVVNLVLMHGCCFSCRCATKCNH